MKSVLRDSINMFGSLVLFYFSIPKLMASEKSVKGFAQFGEYLKIDGVALMYVTGTIELVVVLLFSISIICRNNRYKIITSFFGNVLLLGLMAGAILTETFIRPGKAPFLLFLGILLGLLSVIQIVSGLKPLRRRGE